MRYTTGQALVRFLDKQYIELDGVQVKFVRGFAGVFGHGNVLGVGEALAHMDTSLKFYRTQNEQGAGHMAMGFAKQKNRLQIMGVLSSIGPGAMNMITAAATATANRIPALFLPGDVFATRQPDPVLQQIEQEYDYSISSNDVFKAVSKYWDRISRPEQLMTASINAIRVLADPASTGAVTLSLPQDAIAESYDYPEEFFEKRVHVVQRRPLSPGALKAIADIIVKKKKPLMIIGGGVTYSNAAVQCKKCAHAFRIPYAMTQAGKGALCSKDPFNLGGIGTTGTAVANRIAQEADCLIAIGTRLNDFHTASKWQYQNSNLDIISININALDAYKMNAKPFFADAKLAVQALRKELKKRKYLSSYRPEHVCSVKEAWETEVSRLYRAQSSEEGKLNQTRILGLMNEELLPQNAIIVCSAGSLPSDVERLWRVKAEGSYHVEYAYSCMGYEIAAAIGVKIAEPTREVWVFLGDGSYLMMHQELVTARAEGIKIHVLLVDNGGWQCIDNLQTSQGIERFACELRFRNEKTGRLDGDYVPIDFASNARSYGCAGFTVRNEDELKDAYRKAVRTCEPALIDVKSVAKSMTDGYETWWNVGAPSTSSRKAVHDAYAVIEHHRKQAKKF